LYFGDVFHDETEPTFRRPIGFFFFALLEIAHMALLIQINHHIENYALLQRETNQWKDQAKNWQEHFLRVEQERCSLSSRVDELVSKRQVIRGIRRLLCSVD